MRQILLLPVLVSLLLISTAHAAQAEPPPRSISTGGEASVYVKPDEVVINLGVETFNKNLAESKSANDAATKRLLAAIHDAGVEDKYVKTDVMQVEIIYPDGGVKNGIAGYACRRAFALTLKETEKFEKVVDAALSNGANFLMGVEFRTTDLRKHRDQARKMAIKAAKEKAVDLASELEMKVGPPRTINEGAVGYYGYAGGWWGWNNYGRNQYMAQNAMQQAPGGAGGEGGETMPLGQIAIHASVSVTFDMSEAAGSK